MTLKSRILNVIITFLILVQFDFSVRIFQNQLVETELLLSSFFSMGSIHCNLESTIVSIGSTIKELSIDLLIPKNG